MTEMQKRLYREQLEKKSAELAKAERKVQKVRGDIWRLVRKLNPNFNNQ